MYDTCFQADIRPNLLVGLFGAGPPCDERFNTGPNQGRIMVPPGPEAQATAGPSYIAILSLLANMSSSVRLYVTFVHPTQAIKIFGNVSVIRYDGHL